jgi:DNA-binding transcriptional ArsR family regulator
MLVRIVRNLKIEEIARKIREFKKRFDMSFEEFEELFLSKKLSARNVSAYFEWAELIHAYRYYMESGELDYTVEEIIEFGPEEMALLTPKRMELLRMLAKLRIESINDLAQKIRRDVKNVYQDLQALRRLGFVFFNRRGKRNIVPETLVEEITFIIQ